MSREVRRVPADWSHPRRPDGRFVPLLGRSYAAERRDWEEGEAMWRRGLRRNRHDASQGAWVPVDAEDLRGGMTFEDWCGPRPVPGRYMPDWPVSERTHYQMYETTSEGTPISPAFATPEGLARWLADRGASASGDRTATCDEWLAMIRRGWAPSAVRAGDGPIRSGVEATWRDERDAP